MLILMLGQVSGLRDGKPWPPPGHTMDLPFEEAMQLVGNQMAVPAVDPDTGVEIAVRDTLPVEERDSVHASARESLVRTKTVKSRA